MSPKLLGKLRLKQREVPLPKRYGLAHDENVKLIRQMVKKSQGQLEAGGASDSLGHVEAEKQREKFLANRMRIIGDLTGRPPGDDQTLDLGLENPYTIVETVLRENAAVEEVTPGNTAFMKSFVDRPFPKHRHSITGATVQDVAPVTRAYLRAQTTAGKKIKRRGSATEAEVQAQLMKFFATKDSSSAKHKKRAEDGSASSNGE